MWWWWRASRIIHDRDVLGQTQEVISEFPAFSFVLGDNHPHVLALPFVLLALALALNLLLSRRDTAAAGGNARQATTGDFAQSGPLALAMWSLLIGGLGFLNTWDYPIYLAIFVAV
jgi:uncharacterized membrane protein